MAKRRKLNKKIIFGGLLLLVVVLVIPAFFWFQERYALKSWDTYWEDAQKSAQEKQFRIAERAYGKAYQSATRDKNNDAMIKILLDRAELYKVHNVDVDVDDPSYHPATWDKAIGCWNKIVTLDPKNVEARRKVLDFYYEVSDSGSGNGWKMVESNADELMKVYQEKNEPADPLLLLYLGQARLMQAEIGEVANREQLCNDSIPILQEAQKGLPKNPKVYRLIAQAFRLKGELANLNRDPSAPKTAATEIENLWQTAVAEITDKPDARIGWLDFRLEQALLDRKKTADLDLQKDVDALVKDFPDFPQVQAFLARYYQIIQQPDKALEAIQKAHELDKTNIDHVHQAAVLYYRQFGLTPDLKDDAQVQRFIEDHYKQCIEEKKVIEVMPEAYKPDESKFKDALQAAILYYRQFGLTSQFQGSISWLDKAIAIATDALAYPENQVVPGPLEGLQRNRRLNFYSLLAGWQIEKYRLGKDPKTLVEAEATIQQIQQFLKTSDNVYMGKWHGMVALAKGQVAHEEATAITDPKEKADKTRKANKQISDAITTLYAAYQQISGLKQADPQLAYALAEAFRNRSEVGARIEFLTQAISSMKSDVALEFAETMLGMGNGSTAINAVDLFESSFPPSARSREIRFQSLLLTGQLDKAEEWLKSLDPGFDRLPRYNVQLIHHRITSLNSEVSQIKDSLNAINLQRELLDQASKTADPLDLEKIVEPKRALENQLKEYTKSQDAIQANIDLLLPQRQAIVESMLQKDPKTVDYKILMEVCRQLVKNKETDKAKKLTADYIKAMPQNVPIRTFAKTLDFPANTALSQEQMTTIAVESIREAQPDRKVDQAVAIAQYYLSIPVTDATMRIANRDKARAELQSVAETAAEDGRVIEGFFNLALSTDSNQPDAKPDLTAARTLALKAKELDIDLCGGLYYQARIDLTDRQYASAIEKLTECIRIQPIFPQAYYFRAIAQQALGNLAEASKDADQAYEWTLVDGEMARLRGLIYYQLYRKAGTNPTPEQYTRMNQSLQAAVMLNPDNIELLNFYAELISDHEPDRALAIRQRIMARYPSPENGRRLGGLALRLYDVYDSNRIISQMVQDKALLLLIARKALEKAREMAPNDPALLNVWGEYLRVSGQQNMAERTLPKDSLALVDFYINDGKYAKARPILQQFYEKDQKDTMLRLAVLKGLVIVTLRTADAAGLDRYARELMEIKIEDPKLKEATDLWALQRFLEARLDPEKIRQRVTSFRERYPDNLDGLVMQAWSDFNAGAYADAQARASEILTQKPDHAVAWRIRGVLNRMNSDFKQAIADLQKSLSLVDDPITRIELAQTFIMNGQITSAIGELISALEKPQCPEKVRFLLEKIYKDTGRNEELNKFYDQTVAKYSDDPYWLHRAGAHIMTEYQKQYDQEKAQALKQGKLQPGAIFVPSEKTLALLEKAKPLLENAWKLSEENWKQNPQAAYAPVLDYYLESLLQGLDNQTQLTQFVRIASKYITTPLAPIAYSQMAQAHLRLGDRTKGLELFDNALESAKAQPEYVVQLLDVMRKVLDSDKEVRAWCDKTLAADPKHIGATYTMFQLSQSAGQFNTAIEYIDRCLAQLQAKDDIWVEYTIQKSQVLLQAFFKSSDKKYLDGGVALYESILQASPKHPKIPMILNNLAFLLADNNQQLDKAVEYSRRALNDAPSDPVRMDTLAYTLAKSNQFEEAEKMAKMSIQQFELVGNSVPWDIYYHLGMAQEGLGKKPDAKASYQKALDTGGDAIPASDKEQLAAAFKRVSQ